MWILRYRYLNQDGSWTDESCYLKREATYDVGRSTKSPLHIKNDKSISRQHIRLSVNNANILTIMTIGKVTRLNGKAVKSGQSTDFSTEGDVELELGIKPIKASVTWLEEVWKVPHDLAASSETMIDDIKLQGIQITSALSSKTTLQIIKQNQDTYSNCLFSLIKGIPILRESFLPDFYSQILGSQRDFDSKWKQLFAQHTAFPSFNPTKSVLQGINVIVASQRAFTIFKHIIEVARGSLWLCDDIFNLDKFIKEQVQSDKIIILIHLNDSGSGNSKWGSDNSQDELQKAKSLRSVASTLGFRLHDVNDVVNAVLAGNISSLLERTATCPIDSTSLSTLQTKRSMEEKSPTPTAKFDLSSTASEGLSQVRKRRRINRSQVQPLDSLSFFGGGVGFQSSKKPEEDDKGYRQESSLVEVDNSKVRESSTKIFQHDAVDLNNKEQTVSASASSLKRPPNTEDHDTDKPNSHSKRLKNSESEPVETEVSAAKINVTHPIPQVTEVNISPPKSAELDDMSVSGTTSTLKQKHIPQNSLVEAIQKTKSLEIDRLKKKFIKIENEELTEDAIEQLSDLAIVESKNFLRQRSANEGNQKSSENPLWAGRKNFKKFVKVWPNHSPKSSRESSAEAMKNQVYLITRDYVDLRPYNQGTSSTNEGSYQQVEQPPSMRDIVSTGSNNEILGNVGDDDYKDVPSFSFQSVNRDDHFISQGRQANEEELVTFDRPEEQTLFVIEDEDPKTAQHQTSAPVAASLNDKPDDQLSVQRSSGSTNDTQSDARPGPSRHIFKNVNDHDDDDDDDEPQFCFNSRR